MSITQLGGDHPCMTIINFLLWSEKLSEYLLWLKMHFLKFNKALCFGQSSFFHDHSSFSFLLCIFSPLRVTSPGAKLFPHMQACSPSWLTHSLHFSWLVNECGYPEWARGVFKRHLPWSWWMPGIPATDKGWGLLNVRHRFYLVCVLT